MAVNWPEIGIQLALNGAVLLAIGFLLVRFLRKYVPMWAGGAIGRFWQKLTEEAQGDAESGGVPAAGGGQLSIGGFKIDVGTIREIVGVLPEIVKGIQMLKGLGFLGGSSGGGGGEHPFLK